MAKYTIIIDTDHQPDDEAGLQKVVADYNTTVETPLSVEEYLQLNFAAVVKSYAGQFVDSETKVLAIKFSNADETARTAVKDILTQFQPKFHL